MNYRKKINILLKQAGKMDMPLFISLFFSKIPGGGRQFSARGMQCALNKYDGRTGRLLYLSDKENMLTSKMLDIMKNTPTR